MYCGFVSLCVLLTSLASIVECRPPSGPGPQQGGPPQGGPGGYQQGPPQGGPQPLPMWQQGGPGPQGHPPPHMDHQQQMGPPHHDPQHQMGPPHQPPPGGHGGPYPPQQQMHPGGDMPFGNDVRTPLSPEQQEQVLEGVNKIAEEIAEAVVDMIEEDEALAIEIDKGEDYDNRGGGGRRGKRGGGATAIPAVLLVISLSIFTLVFRS